ncbi:hypothetical protein PNI0009_02065 [Streptococcus pneumoniae PNI0009]|nr:hypothetical protein PNI0009_02065 [Streptococcus pneumoniae PNI0009]
MKVINQTLLEKLLLNVLVQVIKEIMVVCCCLVVLILMEVPSSWLL